MGIQGLLKLLQPITQKQHISSFEGKTIAIDAMPWMYKGCYSCTFQLNQDIETNEFLYYLLEMLEMLAYYKIKPIFVFDGRYVSKKSDTIDKRQGAKEENLKLGKHFLSLGNIDEARKYFSRCIIINERIIKTTMSALHTKGIPFIVAPFEADSQIAKLRKLNLVDAAITEDSDLVVYGVNVLLKLNQNGDCDYIDVDQFKAGDVENYFLKHFLAMDYLSRIEVAIMSGSDYNRSIKGIGIKRSIKLLSKEKSMNKVISRLRNQQNYKDKVSDHYEQQVLESKLIFTLAKVYNPITVQLEYLDQQYLELKPPEMTLETLDQIVGKDYGYNEQVANGSLTCKTLIQREIVTLVFKELFSIDKSKMMAYEAAFKRKKMEQEENKKNMQALQENNPSKEEIQLLPDLVERKVPKKEKEVITEQEKNNRKKEREKRMENLQYMMSRIVDIVDEFDNDKSSDSCSEISEDDQKQKSVKQIANSNKKTENKSETKPVPVSSRKKSQEIHSEEESFGEDLNILNPFAKPSYLQPKIKPQSTKK